MKAEPAEEKGSDALLIVFTAIFFAAYTYFQNVSATPPGGAPATGRFYSESTYALPAAATSIYLLAVLLGPRLMARREAFNLKGAMLVYNAFQTAFNVFTVALFVSEVRASGMRAWGNVVGPEWIDEPKYGRLIWGIWLHYNNKVSVASYRSDSVLVPTLCPRPVHPTGSRSTWSCWTRCS